MGIFVIIFSFFTMMAFGFTVPSTKTAARAHQRTTADVYRCKGIPLHTSRNYTPSPKGRSLASTEEGVAKIPWKLKGKE